MTTVLLDLNVVLDLFLGRQPWAVESAANWNANHQGEIVASFAAVSVPTLFYVARKQLGYSFARPPLLRR